jgi:hypothetical protein
MKEITVAISPLTSTIFAGHLNNKKTKWVGTKQDVTNECVLAVIQLVMVQGNVSYRFGDKTCTMSIKVEATK